MTKIQLSQLRRLVACRGLPAISGEIGINQTTLLRIMSSDSGIAVHAGSISMALAYIAKARA